MAKKAKWTDLGTLRKKEGKNPYLVLDKSVKILVGTYNKDTEEYDNFKEVDLGEYRTLQCTDPIKGIDALLDGGHIDEKEHETRTNMIEDKNIMYKVTVPPAD